MQNYFLADKVYVYPSANAKDGGSDNSEKNLAMITDKFTTNNFVVRNKNLRLENDTSLKLTVNSNGNLVIQQGACVLDGYYVEIKETEISAEELQQQEAAINITQLRYNVFIQLHMDASGLVRGDTGTFSYPNDLCFGVSYLISKTTDTNSELNPKILLGSVSFTEGPNGNYIFDIDSIEIPSNRFAYIDSESLRDSNGRTLEESIELALRKLSRLNYWNNPVDAENSEKDPDSQLYLELGKIMFKPSIDEAAYNLLDKIKCAEKYESTLSGSIASALKTETYNGSSEEHARADHDHDNRYILNSKSTGYAEEQYIKKLKLDTLQVTESLYNLAKTILIDFKQGSISCNQGNLKDLIVSDNLYVGQDSNNYIVRIPSSRDTNINIRKSVSIEGNLKTTGTIEGSKVYNAVWNDYAELYKKADPSKEYAPGTVICKVRGKDVYDTASFANGDLVVGVVSDSYGHLLGGDKGKTLEENLQNYIPIGISGRVYVKVTKGVIIEEGYLMYASGYDGKASGRDPRLDCCDRGTIIGKALESTDGTKDKILMQIMLG